MGLEIIEQVPDVDAVVIPVGGGGLIAGCAVADPNHVTDISRTDICGTVLKKFQ